MEQVLGLKVSTNTINRINQEVGEELATTEEEGWQTVLTGEVPLPSVAIVEYDGGRIRTRQTDCGPGVQLAGKGWNETKNAILVSADSATSDVDPQLDPPACFLNQKHVAKLTETAQTKESAEKTADLPAAAPKTKKTQSQRKAKKSRPPHKPTRVLRTVLSSMKNSRQFGAQMQREARRRRFFEAGRKAFVGDGLAGNWAIHEAHFRDFTPILDFTHAVSYLFRAAPLCESSREESWSTYTRWMTAVWRG